MEDTSGFYKLENTEIFYGPNFVEGPDFALYRDSHSTHTYPVNGWWWFGSRTDALTHFGITADEQSEDTNA
jgi:hypothetical protein